ncbi:MAG: MBL fold metallo-hydrolase [Pseudomonadota bacterium]
MKLIFLGTGTAFTTRDFNYHSNILLEKNNTERLLIDCGSDVRFSLAELGLNYTHVTDIYISHLHTDHVGGLEWVGFNRKFDKKMSKSRLYLHENIYELIWQHTLSGGMASVQGQIPTLETFFDVTKIKNNAGFIWQDIEFRLVQTVHAMNGFVLIPSYGLYFNVNGKNIFITTDTQFCPTLYDYFYQSADLIFHDCETKAQPSGVHTHYNQLIQLPPAIKAKMWLYHYSSANLPDVSQNGFKGFVTKGQVFELNKPGTYQSDVREIIKSIRKS